LASKIDKHPVAKNVAGPRARFLSSALKAQSCLRKPSYGRQPLLMGSGLERALGAGLNPRLDELTEALLAIVVSALLINAQISKEVLVASLSNNPSRIGIT